jgi:hypothetical protein
MYAPLTAALLALSPGSSQSPFEYQPISSETRLKEGHLGHGHEAIEFVAVRIRSATEAIQSWDDCGLPTKSRIRNAPLPPRAPGRKVREFLFNWPERLPLLVKAPPGAEVLQVVRDRKAAVVAVAFPPNAKVSALQLSSPECRRSLAVIRSTVSRGTVPFRRYDQFDPGLGPEEERFGYGLRWFSVPRQPGQTYFVAHGSPGQAVPILGLVERLGSKQTYVAVQEADAERVTQIEAWTAEPEGHLFRNLILDPAPPTRSRVDAPVATVSLDGGGKIDLLQIASKIPGLPYRTWSVDGLPPVLLDESSWVPGNSSFRGLEFTLRIEAPSPPDAPLHSNIHLGERYPHQFWGGRNGFSRIYFDDLPNQDRADLHVTYAFGPWQTVADEGLRGPVLQAATFSRKIAPEISETVVRYTIPAPARGLDRSVFVYDSQGRQLLRGWSSNEEWPKGSPNGIGTLTLQNATPNDVARIRLTSRPWHKTVIPDIPLRPRD